MIYSLEVSFATTNKDGRENQDNLLLDRFVACGSKLAHFNGKLTVNTAAKRLFVVSDGAGGAFDGAKASELALLPFHTRYEELEQEETDYVLKKMAHLSNEAVVKYSEAAGEIGAATVSGLVFEADTAWVFNAGDSPIYSLFRKKLKRLSAEHTMAAEKGEDSFSKNTRAANTLTRFMGNPEADGIDQMVVRRIPIEPSMSFLICSDGIEKGLSDKVLTRLLQKGCTAQELVEKARKGGSKDDITAIVIRVTE